MVTESERKLFVYIFPRKQRTWFKRRTKIKFTSARLFPSANSHLPFSDVSGSLTVIVVSELPDQFQSFYPLRHNFDTLVERMRVLIVEL